MMATLMIAALYTVGRLSFGNTVVEISGSRLYSSSGNAVEIYDISTPTAPVLLSRIPYTGRGVILTMDVSGDTLFVGTDKGSVVALDVSDPSNPLEISSTELADAALSIRVKDSLLLVANGYFGLFILRRSDLSAVSSLSVSSYSTDLDYRGDTVFLTSTTVSLSVIDISDPASPTLTLSHSSLPWCSGGLYVRLLSGNHIAMRCGDTLKVYDITSIASPTYVSTVGQVNVLPYLADTLLTLAENNNVKVFSVSDPASPTLLGDTTLAALEFVSHAAAYGDVLYVFTKHPFRKFLAVSYPADTVTYEALLPGTSSSVDKVGDYLYVYNQGLSVVDVTSPSNPDLLTFIPTDFGMYSSSSAFMDLSYPYLFVAGRGGNEIKVYDVSVPYSPVLDTSYSIPMGIHNCFKVVDLSHVLVCGYSSMNLVDLSSMTFGTVSLPVRGVDLTSDGNYAVVVEGGNLYTVDMGTFSVAGGVSLPSGTSALSVVVEGNRAYAMYIAGTDSMRVAVVDITSPTSPSVLGSVTVGRVNTSYLYYLPVGLEKVGDYLFGSMANMGPFVVDVSDPASPSVVEILQADGYATDLIVSDGYVYQLDNLTGLTVFRAPLPTAIDERESSPISVPFTLKGRALTSDYEVEVYTASGRFLHSGRSYRFRRPGVFFVVVKGRGYRVVVR